MMRRFAINSNSCASKMGTVIKCHMVNIGTFHSVTTSLACNVLKYDFHAIVIRYVWSGIQFFMNQYT